VRRRDPLSPLERSARMARIKGKDTGIERKLRSALFAKGFRYRLHVRALPGCPDLVFPGRRKAIFVHGCFWHLHEGCTGYRLPRTRQDFWLPKLEANRERDRRTLSALRRQGWKVAIVWECELKNLARVLKRLSSFLADEKH